MPDKLFVAYLTSGLGNRLRPLASAMAYAAATGRRLRVYWDTITPNGCLTPLDQLFKDRFDPISLAEIQALAGRSIGLYTERGPGHGVAREAARFGRPQLQFLAEQGSTPQPCGSLQLDEPNDVVIVYDNNYLDCVPREASIAALRSLMPQDRVVQKVREIVAALGLVPGIKGVHARGTDFGIAEAAEFYTGLIQQRLGASDERFFLSTEDAALEDALTGAFPGRILTRNDRLHLNLNEGKATWGDPDSFTISADHGIDALVDLYLLSTTELVVYHPGSTFAEIARHLHGVLDEPAVGATEGLTFAAICAEFRERATALLPRGATTFPLQALEGEAGPLFLEQAPASFYYWETLGYNLPMTERMFMASNSRPYLDWDAELFSTLAAIDFGQFPWEVFKSLCPYPEALSQLATLRGYIQNRRVLIIGSETYWLELYCCLAHASAVTTVEYRPIRWSGALHVPTALDTLTWDQFIADLAPHASKYDLILTYSSIEHSGLGRYGDRLMPLGDLFTFLLMSKCMKPTGMCAVAVPVGQDLTHFNAHRIYGAKRIHALEAIAELKYHGIAYPSADYLANDPEPQLREGWTLANLAKLPLGTYRQPILCFARPGFSPANY